MFVFIWSSYSFEYFAWFSLFILKLFFHFFIGSFGFPGIALTVEMVNVWFMIWKTDQAKIGGESSAKCDGKEVKRIRMSPFSPLEKRELMMSCIYRRCRRKASYLSAVIIFYYYHCEGTLPWYILFEAEEKDAKQHNRHRHLSSATAIWILWLIIIDKRARSFPWNVKYFMKKMKKSFRRYRVCKVTNCKTAVKGNYLFSIRIKPGKNSMKRSLAWWN